VAAVRTDCHDLRRTGEGKLRITRFDPNQAEALIRDLFGDRMGKEKRTATEHTSP